MNITLTESEISLLQEALSAYTPTMVDSDYDTYAESKSNYDSYQNKLDDVIALGASLRAIMSDLDDKVKL